MAALKPAISTGGFGICRIVQHTLVNGVETCQQIAVGHLSNAQSRFDDVQFCFWHCCSPFVVGFTDISGLVKKQGRYKAIAVANTKGSSTREGRPAFSPNPQIFRDFYCSDDATKETNAAAFSGTGFAGWIPAHTI